MSGLSCGDGLPIPSVESTWVVSLGLGSEPPLHMQRPYGNNKNPSSKELGRKRAKRIVVCSGVDIAAQRMKGGEDYDGAFSLTKLAIAISNIRPKRADICFQGD